MHKWLQRVKRLTRLRTEHLKLSFLFLQMNILQICNWRVIKKQPVLCFFVSDDLFTSWYIDMLICINKWFYVYTWGFLQKDYGIFLRQLTQIKAYKTTWGKIIKKYTMLKNIIQCVTIIYYNNRCIFIGEKIYYFSPSKKN